MVEERIDPVSMRTTSRVKFKFWALSTDNREVHSLQYKKEIACYAKISNQSGIWLNGIL